MAGVLSRVLWWGAALALGAIIARIVCWWGGVRSLPFLGLKAGGICSGFAGSRLCGVEVWSNRGAVI